MSNNQRNKLVSYILTAALVLSLSMTGCTAPKEDTLTIGIIQLVTHKALDAAREGFITALADKGYTDGGNITIDYQNAQGDISSLSTIGDRFVNNKAGLVLAITTDAAIAMASKTDKIPIVATAVTSFTNAGLIESDENPGSNVTGASDMNPVVAQIDLIKELIPDVKTIGFLYNPGEGNSVLQIDIAKAHAEEAGLKWIEAAVASTNDAQQAVRSLSGKCEAIYTPTDNTVASCMATVGVEAAAIRLPVFCGASDMVYEGGFASVGIDYYELGYIAGLMAIDILNGADPAKMPIQYAPGAEIVINGYTAAELRLSISDKYSEAVVFPEQ